MSYVKTSVGYRRRSKRSRVRKRRVFAVLVVAMLAMVSALLYNGSRGGAVARSAVPKLVAQAFACLRNSRFGAARSATVSPRRCAARSRRRCAMPAVGA